MLEKRGFSDWGTAKAVGAKPHKKRHFVPSFGKEKGCGEKHGFSMLGIILKKIMGNAHKLNDMFDLWNLRKGQMLMSYAIIRNVKHKMSSLGNMSRHNERQNENYGNPNIESEKSAENFHIKTPVENSYLKEFERIRENENLLGNLRVTGKKQSNVACEFIVTSDNDFFKNKSKEETKKFFEDSYEFVKKKCGDKNVISAMVHLDEKTPHMHVTYIPVVKAKDRKGNDCKRINCSKFWKGYNSYGQLQDEFHEHIKSKGYNLERGEVATGREHLETADLKRQTLMKEINTLEKTKKSTSNKLVNLETKIFNLDGILLSRKKLDEIRPEVGMMGAIKNISTEDIANLKKTALEYHRTNEKLKDLSVKYVQIKGKVPTPEEQKAIAVQLSKIKTLENENAKLEKILASAGINLKELEQKQQDQKRGQDFERE